MKAFYLSLAFLMLGCSANPGPPPIPPLPPEAEGACEAYCEMRVKLNCPGPHGSPGADEIYGNEDDVPCETVCEDQLRGGVYKANRECLDTATTCDAIDVCTFDDGIDQ